MKKKSSYVSKDSDDKGFINWSDTENKTWNKLITHQLENIDGIACDEYIKGLDIINFPIDRIPQLGVLNEVLHDTSGWEVAPVPALIGFEEFFKLLSEKKFPVATFIRREEDFKYIQEPDIFHEVFGHCAMLTNSDFAEFTNIYGKIGYAADKKDRVWLARLYWFTVEFGLINTSKGLRVYGGGILSSPEETKYAVDKNKAEHRAFDTLDVLRTPYRIDIMQPVYFVINSIHDLYNIAHSDIPALVKEAKELGLHQAKFKAKEK